MSIEAPYNFVPLNEKVFYPPWDKDISHDIPFSDGVRGEIKIKIEAKTPIFIRNHSNDSDNLSSEFCHFVDKNGAKEFFIPASSIKGMVRNTLEIMSFAKIQIDKDQHKKSLSIRDMSNRRELVGQANGCGFLVKERDGYRIKDCGKILTISYHEIKNATKKWIKDIQSADEKYSYVQDVWIGIKKEKRFMNVKGKTLPKLVAVYDRNSNIKGQLVFTNKINNKKNEFIFVENGQNLDIPDEIVKKFENVYFKDENSILGQYWKGKERIPIFYQKNRDNKIVSIGLTQLFKLAYNKTVYEAAKQEVETDRYDLAQCVFGYVKDSKALKGRVYFSHLKSSTIRFEKQKEEVLGSPNPTYYPNYIKQTKLRGDKVDRYVTLMDKDAVISGWKQYPLQLGTHSNKSNDNEKITTNFKPLSSGTKFEGKIRFHNLKKAELGALLSALTFHNQEGTHFHNIGMAKPLGYGKIKITLDMDKNLKPECLREFENLMDKWESRDYDRWLDSIQIKNLFAYHEESKSKVLKYQQLTNESGKNDFQEDKKAKFFLKPYVTQEKIKRVQNIQNTNKPNPPLKTPTDTPKPIKKHKRGLKIVKKANRR